jgi:hypothetical protein
VPNDFFSLLTLCEFLDILRLSVGTSKDNYHGKAVQIVSAFNGAFNRHDTACVLRLLFENTYPDIIIQPETMTAKGITAALVLVKILLLGFNLSDLEGSFSEN